MSKKVFYILHGFTGHPSEHWFPWLDEELRSKGYHVVFPILPESNHPSLKDWIKALAEEVDKNGPGTIIGHSLGGTLAMRYFNDGGKAEKIILVAAPNQKLIDIPEINEFVESPFEPINQGETDFVVMYSTDDPVVPIEHGQAWADMLGVLPIAFANKGHFGQSTFPEIIGYLE